ncbi:uncharacterized protein [Haliotis cracherodii]|uniref:uncharacterized protein n=1 Tax=Haliotis cracherodii TaxID=6455 RepID=UPI0039E7EC7A
MSAEFRPTSHQKSADEILLSHVEGQGILEENKPSEYESIDETTAGSYASTDNRNPVSVEYNFIDDVNPASGYQAIEGSQSEANDYECIAGTNPAYDYIEVIAEPRTLTSKCKKTILFLVPIFASVIVNITVWFYTSLMFLLRVDLRGDSSEARRSVSQVLITFCVFSGLAAASCAPLMIRYGFRKVALGGSVLHICSSGFSSLTTTADILAIPFGVMSGTAVGLLRTIGVVATVDHLYTRPALALVISHTSFTFGNIIGITATLIGFTYECDVKITAVIVLVAGTFLQKNSQNQQNLPKLFKHPPFYFLISLRLAASVGLSILLPEIVIIGTILFRINDWLLVICLFVSRPFVLVTLVTILNFQKNKLKKSALLLSGISVLAVGLVIMAHQVTFGSTWAVIFLLGAAAALFQIMLPSALVNTTGRSNLKLFLPVLGCFVEIGGLISSSLLSVFVLLPYQDDQANGAFYFGGVSLIIAGVGAIIAWVLMKRWTPLGDESEEEDHVEDRVEEADDRIEDRVDKAEDHAEDHVEETGDHVEEAEDHVEEAEDQVEEAEDQVEETGDHVEETGDHVEEAEDHVEEAEDQVEETEDKVEETEDHVGEAEDHVEEVEDHVEEAEDHVWETEDHVEEAVDHVEETEDQVEDNVEEIEDHVEDVEDHVEEAEDHVEET